jgi:hypothetical protein
LVEKFKKTVAENSKVEMVHISLDRSKGAAEGWASRAKLPWLTLLPDDVKKTELMEMFGSIRGVPTYFLVKADGEKIGTGSGVYNQVKDL